MTKGVHRVPAGSKRARQMVSRGVLPFKGITLGYDQRAENQKTWNEQIEAKRKTKEKS